MKKSSIGVYPLYSDETYKIGRDSNVNPSSLLQGKKLPPNIDENAEEGDVSDEDSADEMDDDCKLMNGDVRIALLIFFFFFFFPPFL